MLISTAEEVVKLLDQGIEADQVVLIAPVIDKLW